MSEKKHIIFHQIDCMLDYAQDCSASDTVMGVLEIQAGHIRKQARELVAARDDLLSACRAFVAHHEDQGDDDVCAMLNYADAIEAAKSAIKRATEG